MRILFFGTSPFAVPTLQALHDAPEHDVLGVVTQPDRPAGRGRKLAMSPVKELAQTLGYEIHQPERVRRKPFPAVVRELAPDVLVVVSFGQIIPQTMLDIPEHGGINIHASLLPRWRGAAPIHRAILAGDVETGVATLQMEATLDTGPTFHVAKTPISDDDTFETLEARLSAMGATLLLQTLHGLANGAATATPQTENGMTYAAPIVREDGLLDPFAETAVDCSRRVRGTLPRPGAFLVLGGKPIKVLSATVLDDGGGAKGTAGRVVFLDKRGIGIETYDGSVLSLTRVQPENKSAMAATDFARGARLSVGDGTTRLVLEADDTKRF